MIDPLLKATAAAFDEMRMVDGNFIAENNVSADDCHAWCAQVAAILNGYLSAPKDIQNLILAAGAAEGIPHLQEIIWSQGLASAKIERLMAQLKG